MYSKLRLAVLGLASLLAGLVGPAHGQEPSGSPGTSGQGHCLEAPRAALVEVAQDGEEGSSKERTVRADLEIREDTSLGVVRGQRSLRFLLEKGKETTVLSEVEPSRTPWILNRFVLGWLEIRPQERLAAAFFEFLENQGGRKFNDTQTWLRVCVLKDFQLASPCQTFKVAATDVAYYLSLEPPRKWVYLAIDKEEPATISDARVLMLDANDDGYRDLVLWGKRCRAMTPAEVRRRSEMEDREQKEELSKLPPECELHFLLDEETILVSLFQPATSTFSNPQASEQFAIPKKFEWRVLPSLQWAFIP